MALLNIILTVAVLAVVVYLIWYFFFKKSKLLSRCRSGTKQLTISPSKLHGNSHSNNYSYSVWFYVTDWSYGLEREKVLIRRGGASGQVNPLIQFSKFENNIEIHVNTFPIPQPPLGPGAYTPTGLLPGVPTPSTLSAPHNSTIGPIPQAPHACTINNFPLQRWVNLIVSLNNRTLDVYLNGKLVRTCILPAPGQIDPDAPVLLTPDGGFKGWTSNTQYFPNGLNPQEAYNIYAAGPKCGGASVFDKYKLRIQYLVNNQEEASITI